MLPVSFFNFRFFLVFIYTQPHPEKIMIFLDFHYTLLSIPEVGEKQWAEERKRERILQGLGVAQAAVTERWPWKEEKTPENQLFFCKKIKNIFICIYLLVMQKYWGKQIFSLRSFLEAKDGKEREIWFFALFVYFIHYPKCVQRLYFYNVESAKGLS